MSLEDLLLAMLLLASIPGNLRRRAELERHGFRRLERAWLLLILVLSIASCRDGVFGAPAGCAGGGVCRAAVRVGAGAGGHIDGAGGLEQYGDSGLLRSLVVTHAARGTGLGIALVETLERAAATMGLSQLVLLTRTARSFFDTVAMR